MATGARVYIFGRARLYIWARRVYIYIWARHDINAIYRLTLYRVYLIYIAFISYISSPRRSLVAPRRSQYLVAPRRSSGSLCGSPRSAPRCSPLAALQRADEEPLGGRSHRV